MHGGRLDLVEAHSEAILHDLSDELGFHSGAEFKLVRNVLLYLFDSVYYDMLIVQALDHLRQDRIKNGLSISLRNHLIDEPRVLFRRLHQLADHKYADSMLLCSRGMSFILDQDSVHNVNLIRDAQGVSFPALVPSSRWRLFLAIKTWATELNVVFDGCPSLSYFLGLL